MSNSSIQHAFPIRTPLYHPSFPFVIFWSEKAGCTSIVKWFFWQIGLLDEALNYHAWVHNFENDVFKAKQGYNDAYMAAINAGIPAIKFTRNPYNRTFSGYLELCNPKIAKPGPHWTKAFRRRVLASLLGRPDELEYTFTFRQYCNWLSQQWPMSLDAHLRPQFMAEENGIDLRVHHIESGRQGMLALEKEFNLASSEERPDLFTSEHHHNKRFLAPYPASSVFDLGIPVRRDRNFAVIEPTLQEFRSDPIGEQIRRYFADDFVEYGYEM